MPGTAVPEEPTTGAATRGPRVVAVVPARGGSVGVPRKNLEPVGGVPLVERAVRAALAAPVVDVVVVSTDDEEIAAVAAAAGARVVQRPASIAGSTASSEAAVLHALDVIGGGGEGGTGYTPDPVVTLLVQCTSPFIDPADVDVAARRVLDRVESGSGPDVVLSVAATHEFWWRTDDDAVRAVGHSVLHRPRRQDRDPHYRETGAFYAMRTSGLRAAGRRFFGEIGLHLVDPRTAIEIDDTHELWLARRLAGVLPTPSWDEPVDVDAIVTDFDGVHTDDRAWITADGTEHVAVHRGDGLGVAALRAAGVPVLVLSTERDGVVGARARKLGVDVLQGVDDKEAALREWLSVNRLDPARVAYLGNDVNDLPALRLVGWPLAVADARDEVRSVARRVLARAGGHGAVRELAELVLAARGEPGIGDTDSPVAVRPATRPVTHLEPTHTASHLVSTRSTTGRNTMNATGRYPASETAPSVAIGDLVVGDGRPVYVIGEIGINHNGDPDIARQLIDVAAEAGVQAVKFQKRTPELAVPPEQRNVMRQTPWGEMTYLEYKHRVELDRGSYEKIAQHAADRGLQWFASPWDVPSVEFLEDLGVVTHKVASASVTDHEMLRALAETGKPIILSTGMSTLEQIDEAVEILGTDKLVILHATSTYPLPPEETNLRVIPALKERYGVPVGYSGHERGLQISIAAVALGAVAVERHITLDRTMWGSDHASSLEPQGLQHLVRDIRILEQAMGDGVKRVMPGEVAPMQRLRRVTD